MSSLRHAKAKGRDAETAVANLLAPVWPYAERRRLQGNKDTGDIAGTPFVWEVKAEKDYDLAGWLGELAVEIANAGTDYGFVAAKPRGVGIERAEDYFAICRLGMLVRLLDEAGWK